MNLSILALAWILALSSTSSGADAAEFAERAERSGAPKDRQSREEEVLLQRLYLEHEDLFAVLMPQDAIKNNYDETKKSFSVHFKDSFKKYPHPDLFKSANINSRFLQKNAPTQLVTGTMKYVGLFAAQYAYDLSLIDDQFVHHIRVHFKNPKGTDLLDFLQKIKEAEEIWNQSPERSRFNQQFGIDFAYSFIFDVVTDPSVAHFSVNIADSTRGPYYSEWSRDWTPRAIAHELGHMLGLGDEYKTLSGKDDCLDRSLMCQSWTGELMFHNYYHVLKRLF